MRIAVLALGVSALMISAAVSADEADAPPPAAPPATAAAAPPPPVVVAAPQKAAATAVVIAPKKKLPVRLPLKKGVVAPPNESFAWFPGFLRLENGSTRVFLEASKRVEVTEHRAEGRITYRLKGVNVPARTNRLPLMTGYFATPVDRVQLVEAGPDADLVIELHQPSESTFRVLDTPRGMVLQVDFPMVAAAAQREVATRPPPARAKRTTATTHIKTVQGSGQLEDSATPAADSDW